MDFDYEQVEKLLQEFVGKKGVVVPVLQKIQHEFGYLPRPALEYMAARLRIPVSRVYGVATFYAQFHLQPRGKNIIRVCRGTACHVRGVTKVAEKTKELLGVGVGETTADLKFTYEEVACIGACGLAPVMMVNEQTFGKLAPEKVQAILKKF
ncbi:MAG: NADH-quinone oxidoreductase subunit NuoE [Firmicutes bacterium]|nr:NADH-quinone oxidoreductase subunit NuoE [Bacillota bacterium]